MKSKPKTASSQQEAAELHMPELVIPELQLHVESHHRVPRKPVLHQFTNIDEAGERSPAAVLVWYTLH